MKNTAISAYKLMEMFPDEEAARKHIEARRWPNGPICPCCSETKRIGIRKRGYYHCNACLVDFTVRTGTLFERSHVPLNKWLFAMYLLVTSRKGVSSMQLSKEIGVTQTTAWFLLSRIREACAGDPSLLLSGTVEIDETYVGGLEANKHQSKRIHGGGSIGKTIVVGMRERKGRTKGVVVDEINAKERFETITKNIEAGSILNTDQFPGYKYLKSQYTIEKINHEKEEYVRGDVTTNGIESVWAVMKRGLNGVYHHASKKHLSRYVNEFAFRLSDGNVTRTSMERLASLLDSSIGKRLTYKRLIGAQE